MGQECGEVNRRRWQKVANVLFQVPVLSSFWQNREKNACDPTKIVDVGKCEGDSQGRDHYWTGRGPDLPLAGIVPVY